MEKAKTYVEKAILFIDDNYCRPMKISDVADSLCINRSYLYTLFFKETGLSPQQYLSNLRIERSLGLLKNTELPIEMVAVCCGYMDYRVFYKAFKKHMGVSPAVYRKGK